MLAAARFVPALALGVALFGACVFDPPLGDGRIRCATGDGPPCPPGQTCAADGRCYRSPPDLSPDGGQEPDLPDVDASSDPVVDLGQDAPGDGEPPRDGEPMLDLDAPPPACPRVDGCECESDSDCGGDDPVCVAGRCVECRDSSQCRPGEACFPGELRCRDSCTTSGEECDDDEPFCDPKTGACLGCRDDGDCGGSRRRCDPVRARCVACVGSEDCGGSTPFCLSNACQECRTSADCGEQRPVCDLGTCRPACASDEDCAAPETCGGGATPKTCGCTPISCSAAGAECGEIPDGCGGMRDCGDCDGGRRCGEVSPNTCS